MPDITKRYYLCDIIGDGDGDAEKTATTGPFRPAVADYGVSWVGCLPTDPDTGLPLFAWALVLVAAEDHSPMTSDARFDALPALPLDFGVSGIGESDAAALSAAMTRRGIAAEAISGAVEYSDVIRGIGRVLNAGFDETGFDVA